LNIRARRANPARHGPPLGRGRPAAGVDAAGLDLGYHFAEARPKRL